MHTPAVFLAACLFATSFSKPVDFQSAQQALQAPLAAIPTHSQSPVAQHLHGRFLHITDLHPDPHYKVHASTNEEDACHRGKGTSGVYGAETSDCDTPFALINATFKWIEENVRDTVDFVVWTGDSARHDSDEEVPRNADEVLNTNTWIAEKFQQLFSKDDDPTNALTIPIVPTFGNNDILPHNILLSGPNKWLKEYTNIWGNFIPEEQKHGFQRGGWFYVEVIPNKLAIFSLNTLYFFSHNAAVDGCALRSEPGYEHMEWLRIQLQFLRLRGMKAILTGHVPPARTDSKQLWDETCWQKYTLYLKQYRDVVITGIYGHMNVDHFMLQDTKEVDLLNLGPQVAAEGQARAQMDEELTIESANDYLEELREKWSQLPNPSLPEHDSISDESSHKKSKNSKKREKKMGGPWGERFQLTHVGPSVVPNFFPTLRIVEYNITGLDREAVWANPSSWATQELDLESQQMTGIHATVETFPQEDHAFTDKKKRKGKKKPKKPTNPDLIIPPPPAKTSPPGPGYSPQTLTLLGYTQYFANLTYINNQDLVEVDEYDVTEQDIDADKWHEGKHKGKKPKNKIPHPKPFQYQVEYDTFTDPVYKLKDLTVRSYIKLAHRIGQYKPPKGDRTDDPIPETIDEIEEALDDDNDDNDDDIDDDDVQIAGKKHKKKKHHKQHEKNRVWLRFIRRAFVGTLEEEDLQSFEADSEQGVEGTPLDVHEGEL